MRPNNRRTRGSTPPAHDSKLLQALARERLDRSEFLRRAGFAGVSATAASSFLNTGLAGGDSAVAASTSKTLRYGPDYPPGTLDPLVNNYDYPYPPFPTIYEGLLRYPPGSAWRAVNTLAESVERSADGKVVAFTLKQGIPFHRGFGELTAEDVKYSYERAIGKQKLYPDAAKSDAPYYGSDFGTLQQVKVTGKYRGEMHFAKPFAPLLTLTLPYATSGLIISKKAVTALGKAKWLAKPVGTGPYEVVSYNPTRELVMRRFEEYGGAAGPAKSFPWDEIRFTLVAANAAPVGAAKTAALEAGDVDYTASIIAQDAQRLKAGGWEVFLPPSPLNYSLIFMNVKHPKLKDIRVRQAIRYALDIPAIIQVQNLPPNTRMNSFIVRQMPNQLGYWPGAPQRNRDVAQAKKLLTDAGVSSLSLDIGDPEIGGQPNAAAVMQVIKANLAEVGITVNIRLTVPDSYIKNPSVGQLSYTTYGGGPDPFYQFEWFTCSQQGIWNWANWCDKAFSSMEAGDLTSQTATAARTATAIKMQKLMDKSAAFVWTNSIASYSAGRKGLKAVFDPNGNPWVQYFKLT